MAEYRFDETEGPVLHDNSGANTCSSHSCDGKILRAGSPAGPNWTKGALSWPSGSWGYVSLPAELNAARTIQAFIVTPDTFANSVLYPNIWGFSNVSGAGMVGSSFGRHAFSAVQATGGFLWGGEVSQANSVVLPLAPTLVTHTFTQSEGHVYLNDKETGSDRKGLPSLPDIGSGNYLLGNSLTLVRSCNDFAGTCAFNGSMYYVAFYDRVLDPEEVRRNYRFMVAQLEKKGIKTDSPYSTSTMKNIITVGDSITDGYGSKVPYPELLGGLLPAGTNAGVINVGERAQSVASMTKLAPLYADRLYAPKAPWTVFTLWGGTNDVCYGTASPRQTADSIEKFVRDHKAMGARVVIATMLSRKAKAAGGVPCDTAKNELNGILRDSWRAWGADALADVAAAPSLGADSAYSSPDFFNPDGVHPTTLAHEKILAPIFAAAVERSIAGTPAPKRIAAARYVMGDADFLLDADPTQTNITAVLPDCIGATGTVYNVANIAKPGVNHTLTIEGNPSDKFLATAPETIGNERTIAVSPGQSLGLRVAINSGQQGNCHWEASESASLP